jgi:hypothetical protein
VPAIYGHRFFVTQGGLISYGTDIAESFAQAASYFAASANVILKKSRLATAQIWSSNTWLRHWHKSFADRLMPPARTSATSCAAAQAETLPPLSAVAIRSGN